MSVIIRITRNIWRRGEAGNWTIRLDLVDRLVRVIYLSDRETTQEIPKTRATRDTWTTWGNVSPYCFETTNYLIYYSN